MRGHGRTGLDLAVQRALESADEVHLELIRIADDFRIDYIRQSVFEFKCRVVCDWAAMEGARTQDLVRFSEAESKPILLHELLVLLCSLAAHGDVWCMEGWVKKEKRVFWEDRSAGVS